MHLASYLELTLIFQKYDKDNIVLWWSLLNKHAYVWPTLSTVNLKMFEYLRKRSHNRFYHHGSSVKLKNTCRRSITVAQWLVAWSSHFQDNLLNYFFKSLANFKFCSPARYWKIIDKNVRALCNCDWTVTICVWKSQMYIYSRMNVIGAKQWLLRIKKNLKLDCFFNQSLSSKAYKIYNTAIFTNLIGFKTLWKPTPMIFI